MIDYAQTERLRKKRKKKIRVYSILIFLLLAAVIAGGVYVLRRPFLSVQGITVSVAASAADSQSGIDTSTVVGEAESFLDAHRSIFFGARSFILAQAERRDIAAAIAAAHPEWQNVSVVPHYISRTIAVTITPRQRAGLWCDAAQSCVWFDASCLAFAPGPQPEGTLIPFIVDNQAHTVPLNTTIVDPDACQNVLHVFSFLQAVGVNNVSLVFDPASADITATASGTPKFFFNARTDPLFAADAVESKLSALFDRIQYIDLRIPDRIYYKEN